MLQVTNTTPSRTCRGPTRREFLRAGSLGLGSLGLGSLTLPRLLAARERAAQVGVSVKDISVVLLFLQGGPSHIEMFDPKMDAPSEIRSTTGEVATTLPGVTFGGTFPRVARLARRLAVVRSYASGNSGHTYDAVMSARNPFGATAGALYSRLAGTNHPLTGIPRNILIRPEAIESRLELKRNFETDALPSLTTPGKLGEVYRAFDPAGGGELKESMELRLTPERFGGRRELLERFDELRRRSEGVLESARLDRYQEQAFEVITRGVARAFDLSQEDPRTVERYDTSGLVSMARLNRYNDMYRSTNLLGKQMLLARRLCEAGCGFVTVADAGWDMHGNNNSLPRLTGMVPLGHQVDHAVAVFLEDIEARGLSEKILLVITGEMGRTPRINNRGGRDHYGNLTTLVFAGGGLSTGQVIGRSDRQAAEPATERYGPENLLATLFHALFDTGEVRLRTDVPADLADVVTGSEPIRELF